MSGVDMRWEPLTRALLDFGAAPGRYSMRLGEPRELHAQLDTVALWAMGRTPDLLQSQAPALQAAAIAFVQRACFAPDNTHYQVLGLQPGAWSAEQLRTRYRALIRLTHPDMGIQGFPHNAAGLVNRAQEVLSDPRLRSQYDDKLAQAALPVWQNSVPVGAPLTRHHRSDWRHEGKHHQGSGGRWHALNARYPVQLRVAMVAISGAVLVGLLLTWAAHDASESRMLIVARAPQPKEQTAMPEVPATLPAQKKAAASTIPPLEKPAFVVLDVHQPQATPPIPPPVPVQAPTTQAAASPPRPVAELKAEGALTASAPAARTQATAPVSLPAPAPAPAPAARVQTPVSLPSPTPVPVPERVAPAPPPAPLPAPSATPAATPEPENPVLAQVAAPVWSVDTPQARQYLADLVMVLERPQDALRTQNHLTKMNVKGNLLGPSLRLLQQYPQVKVDRISLSNNERPGRVNIQGSVVVQASNPQNDQVRTVKYHVTADFLGTQEGTALAHLHIKESD